MEVEEAIEKSGPVHKITANLLETEAGLRSVQKRLEAKSSSLEEAEFTQKLVWEELQDWHSYLVALEADIQDLEDLEDVVSLRERLVEVQQLHVQLANQAEQKTTLLNQMKTWLQEHQEMITGARSWMSESLEWLGAARTYATANCLRDQVRALKTVLDDSEQIRSTLQGFAGILDQMSQVINISSLREQLLETEGQVAAVQDSFSVPLSQLEQAAHEVERMETEVRKMETNVSEIKTIFCSPETFPSPKEKHLKMLEKKIQSMRSSITDIQKARVHLCLPEKGEDNLTVFIVIDQLQTLLQELEKKVPALFIQESATNPQRVQPAATLPEVEEDTDTFLTENVTDPGHLTIAHFQEDALQRSGASLMRVERTSPEQEHLGSQPRGRDSDETIDVMTLPAEETVGEEPQEAKAGVGRGVLWWLWATFQGTSSEAVSHVPSLPRTQEVPGQPQEDSIATDQSSNKDFQDKPDENISQNDPEPTVDELSDGEDLPQVGGAVSLWTDSFEEDPGEEPVWRQFPPERRPSVGDHVPQEWDHTVDVGGSSSHQEAFGAFSGNISAKALDATPPIHDPASSPKTALTLEACRTYFYRRGYVKLMSECGGSIDHVKRVKSILNDEEKAEGLTGGMALKSTGTGG
ncbi:uncharacterized protein LOC144206512 [Stigmatopora nigra]